MTDKLINYKGITYKVINPGSILTKDNGVLLDQLDPTLPEIPYFRARYIRSKYGITVEDYYCIVVLEGDNSDAALCKYPGCNKPVKFRSITEGYLKGCCASHSSYLQAKRNIEEGTNPFSGAATKEYRKQWIAEGKYYAASNKNKERMRNANLENSKNGTNPFLKKFGLQQKLLNEGRHSSQNELASKKRSNTMRRLTKEGKCIGSKLARAKSLSATKDRVSNGIHEFQNIETLIIADKNRFLKKGLLDDRCYLYIAKTFNGLLKIGVTKDLDYRYDMSKVVSSHDLSYKFISLVATNTRLIVAELECKIKLKFKNFIRHGTEYFDISISDELFNEIDNLLSSTTIETTDEESGKE